MSDIDNDFIDADPFDPAVVELYEQQQAKAQDITNHAPKAMLNRRRVAYANVFSRGPTSQEDLDIVFADLAHFCRAFKPTFDVNDGVHAETLDKMKQGRREVYQRIFDHVSLSEETLFLKYTGSLKP